MLFSKRNKIAQAAHAWCVARNIPTHPLNIVTALVDIGIIKDDAEQSVERTPSEIGGAKPEFVVFDEIREAGE